MLPKCLQKNQLSLCARLLRAWTQENTHRVSIHDDVSRIIKPFFLACLFTFFLSAIPAYADSSLVNISSIVSAQTILQNFATQVPQLMQMITALAYVMGMYLIFFGILKLKQYGESRTMMSHSTNLKDPLILLTAGALLLYLPATVQVGLSTFWSNPNPYGYQQYTNNWAQFLNVCFLIIQFIGTIALIKGLVMLSHLAGHGGHQASFGRSLTHIIGGILCINIYQTVQVILITLGLPTY